MKIITGFKKVSATFETHKNHCRGQVKRTIHLLSFFVWELYLMFFPMNPIKILTLSLSSALTFYWVWRWHNQARERESQNRLVQIIKLFLILWRRCLASHFIVVSITFASSSSASHIKCCIKQRILTYFVKGIYVSLHNWPILPVWI